METILNVCQVKSCLITLCYKGTSMLMCWKYEVDFGDVILLPDHFSQNKFL